MVEIPLNVRIKSNKNFLASKFSRFFLVIYPYIHLSSTTKLLPKIVSENGKSEWIESGFYLELDHISNNHHTFSEQKIDYVIFIGVRIDNEALPSIIGELHFILRVCIIRNLKIYI